MVQILRKCVKINKSRVRRLIKEKDDNDALEKLVTPNYIEICWCEWNTLLAFFPLA